MSLTSIHQVVHGYRDGHRLLSGSTPLGSDAARAMLVLSDMSGPSMQPGFHEYLTGYPLIGAEYFVFAKTWYASEMQRPGCVWTHSLLIPRAEIASITVAGLLARLRRPQFDGVEELASSPINLDESAIDNRTWDAHVDRTLASTIIGAVFGQPRPVIVAAEAATQFEPVFLQAWECLWPAEKERFSFCTGALMPRTNGGALLDLQAVPRTIPPSQFRKITSAALVLDVRAPSKPEAWVELLLDGAVHRNALFRKWIETAAGADAGRTLIPSLAALFSEWHASNSSLRSVFDLVLSAKNLDTTTRRRLVEMAFDRAAAESGTEDRRDMLHALCVYRDADLSQMVTTFEYQVQRLFEDSRAEGVALVLVLLGADLTAVGEHVLRAAVLMLVPNDLGAFGASLSPFLPTIVGANPRLATSPILWARASGGSAEVLAQIQGASLGEEERSAIVEAIICSGQDVSAEVLLRFGGKATVFRGLDAVTSGRIPLSWQWRSALSSQPDAVLEWLECLSPPSLGDLELGSRFVSPRLTQARLIAVWRRGIATGGVLIPRVAAFGLSLAFWEGDARSPLFAASFQPTYDAAGGSRLEYEEWDWLRELAPSTSWYREWDRCERLAAALARLLERKSASLETLFSIVHSRAAIRKVASVLEDYRDTRPYLRSLRGRAKFSTIGTREQRDALLEDW